MRRCSLEWCGNKHKARGYCLKHVAQIRTRGAIVDQSTWTCEWCGDSIAHLGTTARFCSVQHKKNAASARHRQRNPRYYARYTGTPMRLEYREANREVLSERTRRRRAEMTPEQVAQYAAVQKAWWQANKKRHLEYNAIRRARLRSATETVGVAERDWQRLVRRFHGRCAYCGDRPAALHKDHVIPITRGGRHAIGNILPCCVRCNSSKGASLLSEWRMRRLRDGGWSRSNSR